MGRPPLHPTSIHLTLLPDLLAKLDAWRSTQATELSRAEAVRQLLDWTFMKMKEPTKVKKAAVKKRK